MIAINSYIVLNALKFKPNLPKNNLKYKLTRNE